MANSDSGVPELILQREQLRGWIQRLETVAPEAPDRVTQRVRADYEARLQRVIEQLGSHVEELERDLESVRASLGDAAARRDEAADALEEMRLRHMIGELDAAGWDEARPALEGALEGAEGEVRKAESEAERLASLLGEIRGPAEGAAEPEAEPEPEAVPAFDAPAPAAEAEPADEPEADALPTFDDVAPEAAPAAEAPADAQPTGDPFGEEFGGAPAPAPAAEGEDEDLPWLEALEEKTREWETGSSDGLDFLKDTAPSKPAGGGSQQLGEDDLAFLEELDRAIGGGPGGGATLPPPPPAPAPKAAEAPTQPAGAAPAGRLICKECGAPNEPHAWYCEVCGSEL
jgi:hypothetical protein